MLPWFGEILCPEFKILWAEHKTLVDQIEDIALRSRFDVFLKKYNLHNQGTYRSPLYLLFYYFTVLLFYGFKILNSNPLPNGSL